MSIFRGTSYFEQILAYELVPEKCFILLTLAKLLFAYIDNLAIKTSHLYIPILFFLFQINYLEIIENANSILAGLLS